MDSAEAKSERTLVERAINWVVERNLELLLTALAVIVPSALLKAEKSLLPLLDQLEPTTLLRTFAAFIFLIISLTAFLVWSRPKFEFVKRIGAYRDKKGDLLYCTKCRHNKHRDVPLRVLLNGTGWACKACGEMYKDPDYKEPPEAPPKEIKYQSRGII